MSTKNKQDSAFMFQFWSMINVAYLSMTDLKNSKAPRKMPLYLSRRLMWTSNFILGDAIYAYSLGNCLDFAIWDLLCVFTSINYWRDARYDWRRKVDMFVSMPLFLYHVMTACIELEHFENAKWIYLCVAFCCAGLFSVGMFTDDRRLGQITHSIMHVIGSLSSAGLYYCVSQERNKVAPLS